MRPIDEADMERLKALRLDFEREFLPEGACGGHAVLFDFDGEVDHVPTQDELERALAAYLHLIEEAWKHGPQAVRAQLAASELMLGLLGRGQEVGIQAAPGPVTRRLTARIDEVLSAAEAEWAGITRADGFKRLVVMSMLLRQQAGEGDTSS